LFIFLAVFGSGARAFCDCAVPGGLEHIFCLFLGIWCFIASILLICIGILLLIIIRYTDFYHLNFFVFYIIFLVFLYVFYIQTFERLLMTIEDPSILRATWDNFFAYVNGQGSATRIGGGMLGGVIFAFCYYLFSSIGAKIVAVFSVIIGFIFMTELSLGDFF